MVQSLKFHPMIKSSTLLHAPQTTLPERVSLSAIRDIAAGFRLEADRTAGGKEVELRRC
jgi:hypothetical protein